MAAVECEGIRPGAGPLRPTPPGPRRRGPRRAATARSSRTATILTSRLRWRTSNCWRASVIASGGELDQLLGVRRRHGVHWAAPPTITFPNGGKGYRTGRIFRSSRSNPRSGSYRRGAVSSRENRAVGNSGLALSCMFRRSGSGRQCGGVSVLKLRGGIMVPGSGVWRKPIPARSSLHIASIVTGRIVRIRSGMKSLNGPTYPASAFQIDVAVLYTRCSLPAEHVANRHRRLRSTFVGSQPSAFVLLAGRHAQSAFARSLH